MTHMTRTVGRLSPVVAIVLIAAGVAASSPATAATRSAPSDSCDVDSPLIWLKVKDTSCKTGKATSLKMRSYIQNNPGDFDENGDYHREFSGWACEAGFVGSDEVLMKCRKPISHSHAQRKIKSMFYGN